MLYHFEYTSGGNPYIARTPSERDRIIRRHRNRGETVEELKEGFYRIHDRTARLTVDSLTRDQLTQLKQHYYTVKRGEKGVSYGELAAVDNLVTDAEIFDEYNGVIFSEDDFF